MLKDRRNFHRLEDIVNVRYSVKGRGKERIETLPRNIGGGGIGICLVEQLRQGTKLELEITVPDNPQKAILTNGEVLWTRPFGLIGTDQSVNLYETGIKFININPIAVGRVYSYYRQKRGI
jgi:c-di-GMP-binding flagellar brake protein YcgR